MPRSRRSFVWLQLLLAAAFACVVFILVEAVRAARSSQAVAERALHDYASFAAWSYREHLRSSIRLAVDELLGPVNHGEGLHNVDGIPDARGMGHYIPWSDVCQCHRPRHGPLPTRYLGFTLGSDTLMTAVNLAPANTLGWLADAPRGTSIRVRTTAGRDGSHVNEVLTRAVRMSPQTSWGYQLTVIPDNGTMRIIALRPMATIHGDTVIYAVEYSAAAIDSLLRLTFTSSDLLPPSLTGSHTNSDMLDVAVTDSLGNTLFSTGDSGTGELSATTSLPPDFSGLRVHARLRTELANALLIGGVPRSRVPILLVLLSLTAVLTIVAALQLRREARFADERSDFVANVSHELRTPLTQVRLVLDTLKMGRAGTAELRDSALVIADREVLRLQHLVEGVLRFARRQRGDDIPRVPVDAAAEIRSAVAEFQPLATPRGVTIEVSGDEHAPARLQAGVLRQVILNLLDNAVKYGRDNSTVRVDVRARSGGGVLLAVSDSGPGVPPKERERIWKAYERGQTARERATGGSGIGLTVIAEIARAHRGRCWIEESSDGGAKFLVDLPGDAS